MTVLFFQGGQKMTHCKVNNYTGSEVFLAGAVSEGHWAAPTSSSLNSADKCNRSMMLTTNLLFVSRSVEPCLTALSRLWHDA
jgi:hypothetical protein